MVSLDDEIRSERARAQSQANARQAAADARQRERDEVRALALEAVGHLRGLGTEEYVRVRPVKWSLFAEPFTVGKQGYRAVARHRCWCLVEMSARRGRRDDAPMVNAPILLLDDGTVGQCWTIAGLQGAERGEYVSDTDLESIQDSYNRLAYAGETNYVTAVKRRLAQAVVKYERG